MLKPFEFDRSRVRAGFSARLDPDSRADFLLSEIESRMFERLDPIRITPTRILDIGCGLGRGLPSLLGRYPEAIGIGGDFSLPTLQAARAREIANARAGAGVRRWLARIGAAVASAGAAVASAGTAASNAGSNGIGPLLTCCDAQRLPFADASIDLVWSNLTAHWFDDPLAAIGEWYRVSRPGALLMFSAFGVDTLREVPLALGEHRPVFQDMHDWGDALSSAGFVDPVIEVERLTLSYGDAAALERDLDGLLAGARPAVAAATDPAAEPAADSATFASAVTIEITYGHAWCPSQKRRTDGYAPISIRRRDAG